MSCLLKEVNTLRTGPAGTILGMWGLFAVIGEQEFPSLWSSTPYSPFAIAHPIAARGKLWTNLSDSVSFNFKIATLKGKFFRITPLWEGPEA
ncbi:MAG: hypothetical protein AAGA10_16920 [Bacteroidota bacterium]